MSVWDYFEDINVITIENSKRLPKLIENLKQSYFDMDKVNILVEKKKFFGENTAEKCSLNKLIFNIDESCCNNICRDIGNRHYKIIKNAYENNKKNVMIFEDDAQFIDNINKEKIISCIEFLKNNTWDIFYFGYMSFPPIGKNINKDIIQLNYPLLAHCYVVNKQAMKYMLDNINWNNMTDVEYRKINLKKYGIWPCLNYQETPHAYEHLNFDKYVEFNNTTKLFNNITYYNDYIIICIMLYIIYIIFHN